MATRSDGYEEEEEEEEESATRALMRNGGV
jgi:hypothetical protein